MKFLLVFSGIGVSIVMYYLQNKNNKFRTTFNILSVVSAIVFGIIASTSIYQIIKDNAVFMTTIHAIFLNPFFLITGAYLGIFTIYRLMILTMNEK